MQTKFYVTRKDFLQMTIKKLTKGSIMYAVATVVIMILITHFS